MKFVKCLLILAVPFLLSFCGLQVNLYEIATGLPDIQIKSGNQLLAINTGHYNFGDVRVYLSEYTTFSIENNGNAKLRITGISFVEEDITCFRINTTSMSSVLDEGKSTTFNIYFKPVTAGYFSARIIIFSNDPYKQKYIFTVEGYGTGSAPGYPEIFVQHGNYELPEGGSYDFGSITVGFSNEITVTVENSGTVDLQIFDLYVTPDSSTDLGEFYTIAPTIPSGIAPQEYIQFTIIFNPRGTGYKSATVTILSEDPAYQQYTFTVLGEGTVALSPDINVKQGLVNIPKDFGVYDFGSVWVDDTNPPATQFTIENTGTATLVVSNILFTTPTSGNFNINAAVPFTVDPGKSVPFAIQFDPVAAGEGSDGVQILSNDPDEGIYIFTVKGYGTTSPVPDMKIQEVANGSTFDLGPVSLGNSKTQVFTIENTGTENLQIFSIISKDPTSFALDLTGTDFIIYPANTTTYSVIFSSTDTKLKKASIETDSNDGDVKPYKFTITGYGSMGPEPDINVRQATNGYPDGSIYFFPYTSVGSSSIPVIFIIENKGKGDLEIIGIFLKGKLDDFSLNVPISAFILARGESLTATITFTPTKLKKRSASLIIESDDPDESEYQLNLEGYGI